MKDRTTVIDRPGTSRPRDATEPLAPPAGHQRYEVGAEIARGGMGRVVEATDTLLGRTVAVKEALVGSDEALRRFRREIYITARLEHPSIVPVHDAGTLPDGAPYYVMRKVSGRPLTELIARSETLEQRLQLLPHVVAAAQAIGHAHHRGVIHRDIKPSNILVGELGETVVIDWGLAKVIGEADDTSDAQPVDAGASLRTRFGVVFGTPGFMAPEQARGEKVDARSDVYALGATLYYTFTRTPPHASASETEMMVAAASGPATPIGEMVAGLPRELSTIVDKCLAYDDRVRYADAAEVAADLQRFVSGQLVASHEYSRRDRVARFIRKNKVAVAISSIAVVTLLVGGAFALRGIVEARNRANANAALALQRQHDAEAARAAEELRSDQLLLTQAGALATQNPTAAVAQLKQLRQPAERWQRVWRQARAVASLAAFNGVARELPMEGWVTQLAVSPDARRALTVDGATGAIQAYELTSGAHRTLPAQGPAATAIFFDDDHALIYRERILRIVDLATDRADEHACDRPIRDAVVGGGVIYTVDDASTVHRIDPKTWQDTTLLASDRILALAPTRDGRRVAIAGYEGVWVYTEATRSLVKLDQARDAHLPSWDRTGTWLASATYHATALYKFPPDGPPALAVRREFPDKLVLDVAVTTKGAVFYNLSTGYFRDRGPRSAVQQLPEISSEGEATLGMRTFGDTVFLPRGSQIDVIDQYKHYSLISPTGRINQLRSDPDALCLVATTNGHLLVWDLGAHYPGAGEIPEVNAFVMAGKSHAMMLKMFGGWSWLDLEKHEGHSIRGIDTPIQQFAVGGGDTLSFIHPVTGKLVSIHDGVLEAYLDTEVALVTALADRRTAFLTNDGQLAIRSADGKQRLDLTRHREPLDLESIGNWLVAAYGDGWIVRVDLATNTIDQTQLLTPHGTPITLSIASNGDAFITVGKAMYRYERRSRLLLLHAVLPEAISSQVGVAEHTVCSSMGGGTYSVSFAVPSQIITLPANMRGWFAYSPELAVYADHDGTLEMLDATNGLSWPLPSPHSIAPEIASPALSDDSKHLGAIIGGTLVLWDNRMSTSASETARWLDQLTNATAELGTSTLVFHEMLQPSR